MPSFHRHASPDRDLVEHNNAVLGEPMFAQRTAGGIAVLEGRNLRGLDRAYYPLTTVSLVRTPIRATGDWEGARRYQSDWDIGTVPLIPKGSSLSFRTDAPYDITTLNLPDDVFISAMKGIVDLSKVEFDFREVKSPSVAQLIDAMSGIAKDPGLSRWPLLVESAMTSLVIGIVSAISAKTSREFTEPIHRLSSPRMNRVVEYVEANLHRQITLTELAEVASLSVFHFSRKFKNRFGISPLQYLANRRVDAAQRMLRETNEPVSHIAIACGFASQSHFTTVFKKVTGTTPAAFRKAEA